MNNWFTPLLFILLIVSLFVAGLIFNYLNERFNNIYVSWIVHMSANLAINTVGFILFGIIK
ncbi:CPBP family glutamic-type intramembrane protease [Clostridium sp. UBA1056]|uniref:CPBP family glutamic-type intramembrane protease n=1 Tax=unclassified Clostridium TaxID=2614128 RepID=UPI003216ABA0